MSDYITRNLTAFSIRDPIKYVHYFSLLQLGFNPAAKDEKPGTENSSE